METVATKKYISNPSVKDEVDLAEAVKLAAVDSDFYCKFFFPKTFRQPSPEFHKDVWAALEDPNERYVAEMIFRDGAKTTLARTYISKRIAYGMSHTILLVGKGDKSARRSLRWIKRQVQYNKKWAETFQLSKGEKWDQEEIEIIHGTDEYPIRIITTGLEGQIRGINEDDFRPDLIVVDDPCDEENTATPEYRNKIAGLFFGALKKTLAPASECPDAKMVLLQTVLNREDLISQCEKDSEWRFLKFSCFDAEGESRWPTRYPTKTLLAEKQGYIDRNQLSIWLKEMECKVVSPETSAFRLEWLNYWDILPEGGFHVMAIDPVPPPTDNQILKGLHNKDYEALAVVKYYRGNYFLCEYVYNRGHDPEWTLMQFFRLLDQWNVQRVRVETVAYQQTLKWLLEKAMQARRRYVQINSRRTGKVLDMHGRDTRKKTYRIVDGISGPASNGKLWVHKSHSTFIQQYTEYFDVSHEDVLEAVAEAINEINSGPLISNGDYMGGDASVPELENWRKCS